MTKSQPSFLPPCLPLSRQILAGAGAFALLLATQGSADAQPGMTPPGSVAPSPPPTPAEAGATTYAPGPPPAGYAQPAGYPAGPPPATYPQQQPYAQPYSYQPPMQMPPLEPHEQVRSGFNFGLNLGVGTMESSAGEFACNNCSETPPTVAFGVHVGAMINPRLSLLGEVWGQARPLDSNGDVTLNQTIFVVGAQYWLSDRFWAKVGIGAAALSVSEYGETADIDDGSAGMLAIGYELTSSPSFAWDLQLKSGAGFYENEETISSTTVSTGITWY